MSLRIVRNVFLAGAFISAAIMWPILPVFGQVELSEAVDRAKHSYSHIAYAEIDRGTLVRSVENVECGVVYRSTVHKWLQGQSAQSQVSFLSTERLTIGSRYIVFLEKGDLFEFPAGVTPADDQFASGVQACMDDLSNDAPDFWTGFNTMVLEVVSPSFDRDARWINVDPMKFIVTDSITSRPEDVEHCQAHPETLEPTDCSLMNRRTVVPVTEFFRAWEE